ncbi:MAG: hemerythrin domain-containing protein [Bacteroidales bacterium]|nr:hemerythrin domain-containing protein [Bacteroidales bacterium]
MKKRYFVGRMKMADVVAANHTLILAMPRFGISLGFGERSVQEICEQYGLPVDFVLLIFNVYTFDDYLPDGDDLERTDFSPLVPYLEASHRYYLQERLPHIERHLLHVAGSAGERYGRVLKSFFEDYRKEVVEHFESEEREVFPYLQRLRRGEQVERPVSEHFADNHSDLVDKLGDLTQILYKYIPGDNFAEELNELVFAIMQLSADLEKHAVIEEKILLPYIMQLERGRDEA